jgi:hypothetical protein
VDVEGWKYKHVYALLINSVIRGSFTAKRNFDGNGSSGNIKAGGDS